MSHTYAGKQEFESSTPTFTLDDIRHRLRFRHFKLKNDHYDVIITS